jgi:hypothetical protein
VVPAWNASTRQPVGIDEVPFIWMDRALSKYRGVETPDAWVDDALELARSCRSVDGLWVGVWHPNLVAALGFPSAQQAFARLVREITNDAPFVASLETLVRWRRARRGARITHFRADGSFIAMSSEDSAFPLTLENEKGQATGERVASPL